MPSEASWPGAESQKSDKFEKQWGVHIRTQDRCYPIHVLLAQRWHHLSDQEDTDHQLSKGELWWSGYSIHWWGRRSNHRITPPFSNSWNTLCWCVMTVVLFRKGTGLFHTHFLPFFFRAAVQNNASWIYVYLIWDQMDGAFRAFVTHPQTMLNFMVNVAKDIFQYCTVHLFKIDVWL